MTAPPTPPDAAGGRRRVVALASRLFGSTVIAQIAVMAATAFAASRLSPADFGWYGAVSGAVWITASVNVLAADSRLSVVGEDAVRPLVRGAASAAAAIGVLQAVAGLGGMLAHQEWGPMALLVTVGAGATGVQQVLVALIMREQQQQLLARGRLVQGLSNAVLIAASAFAPLPGYLGLSLAWIISIVLGLVPLLRGVRFDLRSLGRWSPADVRAVFAEVKLLPLSQLMAGTVASLPLVVLPVLGEAVGGAWALASRFLTPMVNTAFATLQPLYYARAAELVRSSDWTALRRYHARWLVFLGAASVPVAAFFVVIVWWLLPALGDEWLVARTVLLPACLFHVSSFVCLPLSQTLVLLGRVHAQFWWTLVRCVACVVPFLLFTDAALGLLGWSVAAAVTFLAQLVMHRIAIPRTDASASD